MAETSLSFLGKASATECQPEAPLIMLGSVHWTVAHIYTPCFTMCASPQQAFSFTWSRHVMLGRSQCTKPPNSCDSSLRLILTSVCQAWTYSPFTLYPIKKQTKPKNCNIISACQTSPAPWKPYCEKREKVCFGNAAEKGRAVRIVLTMPVYIFAPILRREKKMSYFCLVGMLSEF